MIKLLCTFKGFTAFLKSKDYLFRDPTGSLIGPNEPQRLPMAILGTKEIAKLMAAPDMRTSTTKGYRNCIILEVLYDN